jgi:hypothetical protein
MTTIAEFMLTSTDHQPCRVLQMLEGCEPGKFHTESGNVPLAETWLAAIAELRGGNVKPLFALPSTRSRRREEADPKPT